MTTPDYYRQLHQLYSFVHPEWYESLDYYHPSKELLIAVRAIIPPTWQMERVGPWFRVAPSDAILPKQGWKIHVSATPINCHNVLRAVATVCLRVEAAFKFSLDRRLVRLSTSKGWGREASGKFITVYPTNDEHFKVIIEALYEETRELVGPYVLSDRRYKDSRVVYYRYGGISGTRILSPQGEKVYVLTSPSGELFPDLRTPYWNPPFWVSDPFLSDEEDEEEQLLLKDGRYRIESALATSVTGGVYLATDFDSGSTVVVKEARPATGIDENGTDAIDRLQKEHRLLQKLQHTKFAPLPLDLFADWEHLFLVEEYVPGLDLRGFAIAYNPIVTMDDGEEAKTVHFSRLTKIWTNLALSIAAIHDEGIVCGDLSLGNVLVRNMELGEVRIVDWEAAWEEGVDPPTSISTPGFTSPSRKVAPSKEDDIYALGAVMLGTLFPMNSLLEVAR